MIAEKLLYGAISLAECISAWLYFSYIYSYAKSRGMVFAGFLLGYGLLYLVSRLGIVYLNMAMFFFVNVALLFFDFSCRIKSAVLHGAFLTLAMGICEVLMYLLTAYITGDYNAYKYSLGAFMPFLVFSKLLYFFVTVFAARLFKPHKGPRDEPSQMLLLCVMPMVSIIILVTFTYIGVTGMLVGLTEALVSVSVFSLLFVNIAVLFIYNRIQKKDEEYAALQTVQVREQADADYYRMLQEQFDGQQILIHDMKKHFGLIGQMAEEGAQDKIRQYVSQLVAQPEFKRRARLCDDPTLNMVLLRYSDYCAANDINFYCDVRAGTVSFMDAVSITALFGNLLSNAVEAAEKSSDRTVELSITKNSQQEYVLIMAVNSCDIPPVQDIDGNFRSSKEKNRGHGYGTKSIARVVQKYDGKAGTRYDRGEKEFHSVICFPL